MIKERHYRTDRRLIIQKNAKNIHVVNNTKLGYLVGEPGDGVVTNQLSGGGNNNTGARGRVQKNSTPTIMTTSNCVGVVTDNLNIRYITDLEAWRLMGFTDNDYNKCVNLVSETQLYKQAGNSIVVQVMEAIEQELLKNEKNIKLFELFAGIGAPRKALENLGIPYESGGYSEIDKHAIKSYNAIYNDQDNNNYGDITKMHYIDNEITLLTGGFPCQDISTAGEGRGIIEGETRSGLMYEMLRIIKRNKPKYVITENVKNLLSKKHKPQFNQYMEELESYGYTSSYKLLNAKDYGIPQNRERVFIVSILEAENPFNFELIKTTPTKELKEFLEEE